MKSAVVAIAKNESSYIEEWIQYNIKAGFDDIYVYQNDWRAELKGSYPNLHLIDFDGLQMQTKSYNTFIRDHWQDYDFAAFFDIDEFIYLGKYKTVNEFLSDYTDVPAVFLNWRLFGDGGQEPPEKTGEWSVLKRFQMSDDKLHELGKEIINFRLLKNNVVSYNPHIFISPYPAPYTLIKAVDPARKYFVVNGVCKSYAESEPVELYHFRDKTYQECYNRKYKQTDGFWPADKAEVCSDIRRFNLEFDKHNRNVIKNTKAYDFFTA